jgi:hypothetical protein
MFRAITVSIFIGLLPLVIVITDWFYFDLWFVANKYLYIILGLAYLFIISRAYRSRNNFFWGALIGLLNLLLIGAFLASAITDPY